MKEICSDREVQRTINRAEMKAPFMALPVLIGPTEIYFQFGSHRMSPKCYIALGVEGFDWSFGFRVPPQPLPPPDLKKHSVDLGLQMHDISFDTRTNAFLDTRMNAFLEQKFGARASAVRV